MSLKTFTGRKFWMTKSIYQIEHTKHRCFENFIGNMISVLIAYNFLSKKPSLNLEIVDIQNIQNLKMIA